jgi:carboxyl-terminal processing protease
MKRFWFFSLSLLFFLAACSAKGSSPMAALNSSGVRTCDYLPGQSRPAQIPLGSPQPVVSLSPTPLTFTKTPPNPSTIAGQMLIFNQIVKDITEHYFSPEYNGVDWNSLQAKYKLLIQNGLNQANFPQAMQQMVSELGDGESSYVSTVGQPTPTPAPVSNFVGIGASFYTFTENGQDTYVLTWVYSGSPAGQAGLKNHDALLKVDGGRFLDENGAPRTRGPEGSSVTITVQTPGQAPRDVKVVRRAIDLTSVVDYCRMAGTAIGYIRWFDINNSDTVAQTVEALKQMSLSSPLQGLIIDLRQSNGSSNYDLNNLQSLVGLFTSGNLGSFIAPRGDSTPLVYTASQSDISGSQKLPLVVIQDLSSGSIPLITGVLQVNGRARIVGQTADGEVYNNFCNDYVDGSTLCIANEVFQPVGKTPDYWKKTGVVPDVLVNGRWDQYTEADDPYLAKAVSLLMQK